MKKTLIILLAIIMSPICMAQYRTITTAWRDRDISYQAQYKLDNDITFQDQQEQINISVATCNYMVLLVGQVPSAELKQRAEDIVRQIPNVRRIYNQITINPPISAATRSNDTWITARIKSKLLFTKSIKSTKIKVVTENSIVYLMGVISKQQGDLVVEIVSQVNGVAKIVKIFEYIN